MQRNESPLMNKSKNLLKLDNYSQIIAYSYIENILCRQSD